MPDGLTVLSVMDFEPRKMGSFEEYVCALGRQLREAGGRCVVGVGTAPTPQVADAFRRDDVEWAVLPFGGGTLPLACAVRALVRRTRPDVAHFHFVHTGSPLFLVARLAGAKKVVMSHHNSYVPGTRVRLFRLINRVRRKLTLALCARLITPSGFVRDCLVDDQRIRADRIQVIHNGVNLRRFDPDHRPSFDVRAEFGIPADAPLIATVALFIPEKGGHDLIAAMPAVLDRVPNAHLLMIGDGPDLPRLKSLTEERALTGHVHFAGLASGERLDSLLAATLITSLCCTWGEAFSLVVLEFMACGKPTVATAVGGTPEAIEEAVTGLLVPPHSPERIAEALITLLEDPERAKHMGQTARRRAEERFSVERMVADTLAVYTDITS